MATSTTWVAVTIWVLIALFILYVFLYQRTGVGIQDREFIAERLGAQTIAVRNARASAISKAFPRTRLQEKLLQAYGRENPVEIANVLEGPGWLERVANNEDPESRFLPRNAPEVIRDFLDTNYPDAQSLPEALGDAIAQLEPISKNRLLALQQLNQQ